MVAGASLLESPRLSSPGNFTGRTFARTTALNHARGRPASTPPPFDPYLFDRSSINLHFINIAVPRIFATLTARENSRDTAIHCSSFARRRHHTSALTAVSVFMRKNRSRQFFNQQSEPIHALRIMSITQPCNALRDARAILHLLALHA